MEGRNFTHTIGSFMPGHLLVPDYWTLFQSHLLVPSNKSNYLPHDIKKLNKIARVELPWSRLSQSLASWLLVIFPKLMIIERSLWENGKSIK
jgi:hypothetical protein